MPKPKRRPPVVKTDWVVDEVKYGFSHYTTVTSLSDAKASIRVFKKHDALLKRQSGEFSVYERKWRKVDL